MVGPRSQSRRYAALILYQWRLTGDDPMAIKRQLLDDPQWLDAVTGSLDGTDDDFPRDIEQRFKFNMELFDAILAGLPRHVGKIDRQLTRLLNRPINQVDSVELALLRLRRYAALVLYQRHLTGEDVQAIKRQLLDDPQWLDSVKTSLDETDEDLPHDTKQRFKFDLKLLDQILARLPRHDRPVNQIYPVELGILRLRAFEILYSVNTDLLDQILAGVPRHLTEIDASLDQVLDRPITQVDPVELAILRLGVFEILFSTSVPARVAINEAVELTKLLGAHEGHKYVNGVLDKIARRHAASSGAAAGATLPRRRTDEP